jgi:VWFA-related protein
MTIKTKLLIALAPLLGLGAACAQEINLPKPPTTPALHLDVVVTPKSGSPVIANLQQHDFTILDNKVPQPITSFKAVTGSEVPAEIVILIDAVNTNYQQIAFEREEIDKFLRANSGHLAHPTTLAILGDKGVEIQQSFTTDGNAIADALDKFAVGLRTITRSAGIYGADERLKISLDALHLLASNEAAHPGRKLILWASPGWPLLSGPGIQISSQSRRQLFSTIVDFSNQLRQARITLYAINPLGVDEGVGRTFYYQEYVKGVSDPGKTEIGDLSLQVLATQSGGLAISSTGVAELLQKAVADLDAYYELTFIAQPGEKPNEYHHIEVQVDKPEVVARTRQGYYAQP